MSNGPVALRSVALKFFSCLLILFLYFFYQVFLDLLDRTGIVTVAMLAGDIGQSGLVPGRESPYSVHLIASNLTM